MMQQMKSIGDALSDIHLRLALTLNIGHSTIANELWDALNLHMRDCLERQLLDEMLGGSDER